MSSHIDTKEDLKSRMLRNISVIWGIKNTETLDPLVRIMIEALAGELDKTHHDIYNFEKRILEKIATLMTPDLLSAPYCAHGVVQAKPTEASEILAFDTHLFYSPKADDEKESPTDFFFTPVDNVYLVDGSLKYIVAGNKAFTLDKNAQKSIFLTGENGIRADNDIWLGLKLNNRVDTIDKLRFYFDLKNTENKQQLLSLLRFSKWFINSTELESSNSILYEKNSRDSGKEQNVFSNYDVMHLIEQEIKHLYESHFVTLKDPQQKLKINDEKKCYPSEFERIFSAKDLLKFNSELTWIRVSPNSYIDEKTLFDLYACINAFPVLNRRLKKISYRFRGISNLIPIKTDFFEYFLFVKSLKDIKGRKYSQIPFSHQEEPESGTYSVRKGGVERLDPRSAKEFLSYLSELARDEAAIFSSYGQDKVINLLKDLERVLAKIDLQTKQNKYYNTDLHHYISMELIEKQDAKETFSIEYWVTNASHANAIHTGERLSLYEGTELKNDSIILLTNTTGGKKNIDPSRHMDAYKYAILTHNRLVTPEDIKAFCMFELGDRIEQVTIRKGIMNSPHPKAGLVRCTDILLKKNNKTNASLKDKEWELILNEVKSKMELRSAINANYRLILTD